MLWMRGGRKKEKDAIEALEKAMQSLESSNRLMKIEWESVLHKMNQVMGRLNARIRKAEAQETPHEAEDREPTPGPRLGNHATLRQMRGRHGLLPG